MTTLRAMLLTILIAAGGMWGVYQSDWYTHRMIRRVQGSIVHLTGANGDGVCSGFVIAPNRFLTAQHCVASAVAADGQSIKLLRDSEYYDLALFATTTQKPAVAFQDHSVYVAEPVTSLGYAWGVLPVFQHSEVTMLTAPIQKEYALCVLLNHENVNGMSGGPVIDQYGYVVSIVSRGNAGFACGVSTLLMRAFLEGME